MTAEPWRVAQIVVERGPSDDGSRGSGYLVAAGVVLTAAHVVAGASGVRVRLDVGQQTEIDVQAEQWWADTEGTSCTDLAVVMIPQEATEGRAVQVARFGRISDGIAVLAVRAFGFPLFKLRHDRTSKGELGVFRDLEQVAGHTPVAANRRQGTLAVYLDDPPPASSWEGMSGASVWAADRIIGIVAEHHPDEGTGRLTARRIDRAYETLLASDLSRLINWLELAPALGGLPNVVPAEPGQFTRSAYLEQVRDIAPDMLIGRDQELAEWAEFCAGPDPYAWWQAGPWAGKSALASWFVTHPPGEVDVVSFFITGRLVGHADSGAFLDAMIEQLNALAPRGGSAAPTWARTGAWLRLLESAAARAGERSRRLVIVVDGLDEDDAGATPVRGRPSIASLLPRRPPPGVRVIVTSRPDPGLPDDVPSGHPMRTCIARRLAVSRVAEDLEQRAKQELRDLLSGDQTAIDVVGFLAASGGGLTRRDLSALTGAAPLRLDPVLRGVSGRSLQTRVSTDARGIGADSATRVYLFAHETLRATAEDLLGDELVPYLHGIHRWIGSYVDGGWPDTTPGYGIRGYPSLLTATGDASRLSALARDSRRHAFLLRLTGSEHAALAEIRTALNIIAEQDVPDLPAMIVLAIYRHAISIRNAIPDGLPAVWAQLDRFDHAEALAQACTNPSRRAHALIELATAAARAGDPERANRLADDVKALARTDPMLRRDTLIELASAAAQTGDPAQAEALARSLTDPGAQAQALARLATAAAQAADPERVYRLAVDAEAGARALTLTDPEAQEDILTELTTAVAGVGDLDWARTLARTVTRPGAHVWALARGATAAARAVEPERAYRLAAEAEAEARTLPDRVAQGEVFAELASAAAQNGDADRAYRLAAEAKALAPAFDYRGVPALHTARGPKSAKFRSRAVDPTAKARMFAKLATVFAQAGDPHGGEILARTITDTGNRAQALAKLATAAARSGDPGRADRLATDAETVARTITEPNVRARVFTKLASAAAQAGSRDHAFRLAAEAEALAHAAHPSDQARALTELASAAAQASDPDRARQLTAEAEVLVHAITDSPRRAQALIKLATAVLQTGDSAHAYRLATGATALIAHRPGGRDISGRTMTSRLVEALAELAAAFAYAGDPDDAEALARTIRDQGDQAKALAEVAIATARAGNVRRAYRIATRAERVARTPPRVVRAENPRQARSPQETELVTLVTAFAQAGDLDRSETLARAITSRAAQAQALSAVAAAAAQAGDTDRARRLADDAQTLIGTMTGRGAHPWPLVDLITVFAQIGDLDRSETLARAITSRAAQAQALSAVAAAAAQAGDTDRARRLAGNAQARALTIFHPVAQAQALTALATAAAQGGDMDRAQYLLAYVLCMESPEIGWWLGTASQFFPAAIRDAGTVFMNAYEIGLLRRSSADRIRTERSHARES